MRIDGSASGMFAESIRMPLAQYIYIYRTVANLLILLCLLCFDILPVLFSTFSSS